MRRWCRRLRCRLDGHAYEPVLLLRKSKATYDVGMLVKLDRCVRCHDVRGMQYGAARVGPIRRHLAR